MIETMTPRPLLALLHICDSLFPIGGFGYSDGLEAATATGLVQTPADLEAWLDVCLDEVVGRMDGPAVAPCMVRVRPSRLGGALRARRRDHGDATVVRDAPLEPSHGSQACHDVECSVSRSAADTAARFRPYAIDRSRPPIAFGCACASAGIGMRDAGAAFAYTRLASTTSAALRLMRIGQTDAHAQLAKALGRVPIALESMTTRARLKSFTPAMDLSAMTQQYLHSRLFRS